MTIYLVFSAFTSRPTSLRASNRLGIFENAAARRTYALWVGRLERVKRLTLPSECALVNNLYEYISLKCLQLPPNGDSVLT
jgi:hypothetical protein